MVALVTSRLWFVTLATVVLAVGCRAKSRSHATGGAMTVNAAVRNLFDAWNAGDVAKLAAQMMRRLCNRIAWPAALSAMPRAISTK